MGWARWARGPGPGTLFWGESGRLPSRATRNQESQHPENGEQSPCREWAPCMSRHYHLQPSLFVPPLPVASALGDHAKSVSRQDLLNFGGGQPSDFSHSDGYLKGLCPRFERNRLGRDIEENGLAHVRERLLTGDSRRCAARQLRAPNRPISRFSVLLQHDTPFHPSMIRQVLAQLRHGVEPSDPHAASNRPADQEQS